jgi:hypothetical protein
LELEVAGRLVDGCQNAWLLLGARVHDAREDRGLLWPLTSSFALFVKETQNDPNEISISIPKEAITLSFFFLFFFCLGPNYPLTKSTSTATSRQEREEPKWAEVVISVIFLLFKQIKMLS